MKQTAWIGLLVTAGLSGCLPNDFVAPSAPEKVVKPAEPTHTAIRPPVTAGQINGANAQEKAAALRDELDRDLERALNAADKK
jgi:hypothetical protein